MEKGCGMEEAMPKMLVAASFVTGVMATAGWFLIALAKAYRDHDARVWLSRGVRFPLVVAGH